MLILVHNQSKQMPTHYAQYLVLSNAVHIKIAVAYIGTTAYHVRNYGLYKSKGELTKPGPARI